MNPMRQLMDLLDPRRADQRSNPRRGAAADVRCSAGRVIDFSMTGMRLRCRKAWPEGQSGLVTLTGRPERVTLSATGVWSRKEGWRNHVVGVTFGPMDPQQRATLLRLVERHGVKGEYSMAG